MEEGKGSLRDKTLYIPRMSTGGAEAFAAAFRNLGIDARVVPEGDERTYELAGRYTSGDECLPARVTVGSFLKVMEDPSFQPSKSVFFMPTASGPCRFGQYAPFMRLILEKMGRGEIEVVSPTSANGYGGLGQLASPLMRICWMALIASDALRKLLHIHRPRESAPGAADAAWRESLDSLCRTIEETRSAGTGMARAIAGSMKEAGERFGRVPIDDSREMLLIGVVGEIFCRLDTFSNEDLIRSLEKFGAVAWLSDISEWVWYTDTERMKNLRSNGRTFSGEMAQALTKKFFQKQYESTILRPLRDSLALLPEPHDIMEILSCGEPYLPWKGALGEMALSVGKSVYMHGKGVDGIVDISPFTCMNGIVAESVYPRLSREHDDIPIRSFYFDGTRRDLESELSVFVELARGYNRKKAVRIKESA